LNHLSRRAVPNGPIVPQGRLAAAFAQGADPRRPFGWHPDHPPLPLDAILLLTVAALLAGATSITAVAQWGRERLDDHPEVLLSFGFPPGRSPSVTTLHRLYRRVDVRQVAHAIQQWTHATGVATPPDVVAIDGQTLRALANGEVPGAHVISLFAPTTRQVLADALVAHKGYEQAGMQSLLDRCSCAGQVVTFDALHTHLPICTQLEACGATLLAPVKGNQKTLRAEVQALFADWPEAAGDPPPWWHTEVQAAGGWWQTTEQQSQQAQHGRTEWRRVCVLTDPRLPTLLGSTSHTGTCWAMVQQVVRVERRRWHWRRGQCVKTTHEVVSPC
jgi:hypothetical protein